MSLAKSLLSGLAGAAALTIAHQVLKKYVADAPRMDKLGKQALKKVITSSGCTLPSRKRLKQYTLVSDVLSNAVFYSMVGASAAHSTAAGAGLGLSAGIGAVTLPEKLGLHAKYASRTKTTALLTVGLYLFGGIVAGTVYQVLDKEE